MPYRLADLAALVGGRVEGDGERPIDAVRTLEAAGPRDLSFLTNPRYRERAAASDAAALLVAPGVAVAGKALLVAEDPYFALSRLLAAMHPPLRFIYATNLDPLPNDRFESFQFSVGTSF